MGRLLSACQGSADLAPRIYEGGAPQGRGGVRIFAQQIFGKAHFSKKWATPSPLAKRRLRRLLAARACGRSDLASLGHLKVNCPKGKRGDPAVPT